MDSASTALGASIRRWIGGGSRTTVEGDVRASWRGWRAVSPYRQAIGAAVASIGTRDPGAAVARPHQPFFAGPLRTAGVMARCLVGATAVPDRVDAGAVCWPRRALRAAAGDSGLERNRLGSHDRRPCRRLADPARRIAANCERPSFVFRIAGRAHHNRYKNPIAQ